MEIKDFTITHTHTHTHTRVYIATHKFTLSYVLVFALLVSKRKDETPPERRPASPDCRRLLPPHY
jgi:hypothetical protein